MQVPSGAPGRNSPTHSGLRLRGRFPSAHEHSQEFWALRHLRKVSVKSHKHLEENMSVQKRKLILFGSKNVKTVSRLSGVSFRSTQTLSGSRLTSSPLVSICLGCSFLFRRGIGSRTEPLNLPRRLSGRSSSGRQDLSGGEEKKGAILASAATYKHMDSHFAPW